MFDSQKELLEKIALGESTYLEFKDVRFSSGRVAEPKRDKLADGLAALANSRGGVFVLGVDDKTHDIVGIPPARLDGVVQYIREILTASIDPPIEDASVDRLTLPASTGKELAIVKVDVPRSLFVHRSPSGYLHRLADGKRAMSSEYLARLFQQRSQTGIIRFDEQPVASARLEDLVPILTDRFRTPRSDEDRVTFLRKLGMAVQDDGNGIRPTVAGVLMGTDDPRKWLPSAYVQAVAYRGNAIRPDADGTPYQLDAQDVVGPLDRQITEACRFVARNMRTEAFKDQGRRDRPQYDMAAVFEAVVNAVAHRDYSIRESKIRLRLFENRLEIYSPGAIANSLSLDSLRYRQATRNDAITSLLLKCPVPEETWLKVDRSNLLERRGEGVPVILDRSEELSGTVPVYRLIDDAELLLSIYAAGGGGV
ncbi:MAG: putative DNA binding domain-containing protein [Rhodospirillaceae bacterium]|nr:putative DNA binding domain-containing protein [Rhodospirillaceae bacterium]